MSTLNCLSGRKLSLSEQLTAMVMFELPFYGLLPGAVPFIYFVGKGSSDLCYGDQLCYNSSNCIVIVIYFQKASFKR